MHMVLEIILDMRIYLILLGGISMILWTGWQVIIQEQNTEI